MVRVERGSYAAPAGAEGRVNGKRQLATLHAELEDLGRELSEAHEQQAATTAILRAISNSRGEVQPVLNAVVQSASRLCRSDAADIWRIDGDTLRAVASIGSTRHATIQTIALNRGSVSGRSIVDRCTIHVPDLAAEVETYWLAKPYQKQLGHRTTLASPLLLRGEPIGTILLRRTSVDPFTDREIALLQTFAEQAVIAIEHARLFSELRERDERRQQELERANAIQQRLLPERVEGWPDALELAVRFRAAVETSGDFYDAIRLVPLSEGSLPPLQIAVGDVAGKGMAAALVTALARSALRASASVPTGLATPASTLRIAGQRLHRDVGSQHFVACALGVVEPPTHHTQRPLLRLANAAQVPTLLVRRGTAMELEPPGYRLPLGTQPDGRYEDLTTELSPGDVVVFSSDGLVEAPARTPTTTPAHLAAARTRGELFGFERLRRSATYWSGLAADGEAVADGIWSDLAGWCGEDPHHDDMTLLVLRVPHS